MGKAYVLKKPYLVFSGGSKGVEEEMEVFLEAIRKTKEELSGIKEGLSGDAGTPRRILLFIKLPLYEFHD